MLVLCAIIRYICSTQKSVRGCVVCLLAEVVVNRCAGHGIAAGGVRALNVDDMQLWIE